MLVCCGNFRRTGSSLTSIKRIDTSANRHLIGEENSRENSQDGRSEPPSKWVAHEVDLALGRVLRPETDSTKQERPLNWLGSVRVRRCQGVVVVEHCPLKFNVLLHKRHALCLADLFDQTRGVFGNALNVLDEPRVGGLLRVLVSVNLRLLVSPFWEWGIVSPHGNLGRDVNQLEV